MEENDFLRLKFNHQLLVDNLQLDDVITHLMDEGIINDDQYELLTNRYVLQVRKSQIIKLLQMLYKAGPRAYEEFQRALQEHECHNNTVKALQTTDLDEARRKFRNETQIVDRDEITMEVSSTSACSESSSTNVDDYLRRTTRKLIPIERYFPDEILLGICQSPKTGNILLRTTSSILRKTNSADQITILHKFPMEHEDSVPHELLPNGIPITVNTNGDIASVTWDSDQKLFVRIESEEDERKADVAEDVQPKREIQIISDTIAGLKYNLSNNSLIALVHIEQAIQFIQLKDEDNSWDDLVKDPNFIPIIFSLKNNTIYAITIKIHNEGKRQQDFIFRLLDLRNNVWYTLRTIKTGALNCPQCIDVDEDGTILVGDLKGWNEDQMRYESFIEVFNNSGNYMGRILESSKSPVGGKLTGLTISNTKEIIVAEPSRLSII